MNRWIFVLPELLQSSPGQIKHLQLQRLETVLSRAQRKHDAALVGEQILFQHFGYPSMAADRLPLAHLHWHADFKQTMPADTVCVAPLHMLADRENAQLLDQSSLQLQRHEADSLINSLNRHFSTDGISFRAATTSRWYMHGLDSTPLSALPLNHLTGRRLAAYLQQGMEATRWRQLMTEAQMLLFNDDINQQRQSRGLLPVNGLWFWGAGSLPSPQASNERRVYSDNFTCSSLVARVPSSTVQQLSQFPGDTDTERLVFDDSIQNALTQGDQTALEQSLQRLEELFLASAISALKRGHCSELQLYPLNGYSYHLRRKDLRKFWRRRQTLQSLVSGSDAVENGA